MAVTVAMDALAMMKTHKTIKISRSLAWKREKRDYFLPWPKTIEIIKVALTFGRKTTR